MADRFDPKPRRFVIDCSVSDEQATALFEALLAVADLVDPGEVDVSMTLQESEPDIGRSQDHD